MTPKPERHVVYPGGPDCQPNCPGPWSQYHDGYADGYENAEAATLDRIAPDEGGSERDAAWWLEYVAIGVEDFIADVPPGQNVWLEGKNAGLKLAAASIRSERAALAASPGEPATVPPTTRDTDEKVRDILAGWLWQFNDEPRDGEATPDNRQQARELMEHLRACRLSIVPIDALGVVLDRDEILCLCRDIFPTIEDMHDHIHMAHDLDTEVWPSREPSL